MILTKNQQKPATARLKGSLNQLTQHLKPEHNYSFLNFSFTRQTYTVHSIMKTYTKSPSVDNILKRKNNITSYKMLSSLIDCDVSFIIREYFLDFKQKQRDKSLGLVAMFLYYKYNTVLFTKL